jgi:hypothetical protein
MRGKMAGGRPLKFENVKQMKVKIDAYFKKCKKEKRPLTICGLAYALDIERQTLLNYQEKDEFFDTIIRAKRRIQVFAEESLYKKELFKGAQFSLKNNHGWKDKLDVDQSLTVNALLDSQLIKGRQKLRQKLAEKNNDSN